VLDTTHLRTALGDIQADLARVAGGTRGASIVGPLRDATGRVIPSGKLLWQALHADCLRVTYVALAADQMINDDELEAVYDYLYSAARNYADTLRAIYAPFNGLPPDAAREFLATYGGDDGPFGFRAAAKWTGLDACRRAAALGEREPLDRYEQLMAWLCDAVTRIGGVEEDDPRHATRLDDIAQLRRALADRVLVLDTAPDLRAQAFATGRRVFSSVAQADSVFEPDPFDVEEVHAGAREAFERLLDQATTPARHQDRGRMLLVLGDSGAGKTHLMRAFRRQVHDGGRGFAAYAQLHSRSEEYGRYLLHNVIESLEKPFAPSRDESGLLELSNGLARLLGDAVQARIARLADDEWPQAATLADYVNQLVDELLTHEELERFDPDLLRALLYLQRRDSRTTPRVLKYLRCEGMNAHDRRWIGDVQPRTGGDDPLWMIQQLARLAFVTEQAAFVLMVDQAELAGFSDETVASFKRAIDALHVIVSEVPSAIAVIACLEDVYTRVQPQLTKSAIDRLESDPPIERLAVGRTYEEIVAIVARRLAWLYADAGAVHRDDDPTFPIPTELLRQLANRRIRDVLDQCHRFQEDGPADGVRGPTPPPPGPDGEATLDRLAAAWNDHLHGTKLEVPDDDDGILALVDEAARAAAEEQDGLTVATRRKDGVLEVDLDVGGAPRTGAIGVANRGYQRGAFGSQVDAIRAAAKDRTPIVVRTSEFPQGKASNEKVAALLKAGGRKVQLTESDLRAVLAMREFTRQNRAADLRAWRRRDRPILQRAAIQDLLDLRVAQPGRSAAPPPAQPQPAPPVAPSPPVTPPPVAAPPPTTPPSRTATHDAPIHAGTVAALNTRPFDLEPAVFLRHMGILGTSGGGKTTLALNLIEQLLERDIPVVLVDRKGDLAGYARHGWWRDAADPTRAEALAGRLDVRLFTPGMIAGRPLAFGVVPDLDGVPAHDRGRLVQYAALALAAMMRLGAGTGDAARRAILTQAIDVLAERSAPASLPNLLSLLESRDDALIARAGRFDDRLFQKLVVDLETLRLNEAELFDPTAEQLSADLLLGRRDRRTPLTIVSTRFLGDNSRIQAWVSHLLVELSRWCMRSPRAELQAAVMLDEADLYMPAGSVKPPSKEPLHDLLRRARSGGLAVMLASQSPGDFDYRARDFVNTWFIGKIGDKRSIDKVKALLERKPTLAGKLPTLAPGHFVVVSEASALEIERRPSLLRTDQLAEADILQYARATRG